MAKLSARGRYELGRWVLERETPESDLTIKERRMLALMSDGRVLRKIDVTFKPDPYYPEGRKYPGTWKQYLKMKPGINLQDFEIKLNSSLFAKGYSKVE